MLCYLLHFLLANSTDIDDLIFDVLCNNHSNRKPFVIWILEVLFNLDHNWCLKWNCHQVKKIFISLSTSQVDSISNSLQYLVRSSHWNYNFLKIFMDFIIATEEHAWSELFHLVTIILQELVRLHWWILNSLSFNLIIYP